MTELSALEPWDIASMIYDKNLEVREKVINGLSPYTYTLSSGYKVDRSSAVKKWLEGYDNNEAGDVRGFLEKKRKIWEKKKHAILNIQ